MKTVESSAAPLQQMAFVGLFATHSATDTSAARCRSADPNYAPPPPSFQSLSESELTPLLDAIKTLHDQIKAHVEAALYKAIRLGGKLHEVQAALKHTRGYESWVENHLPFSVRTARDYVTLFLHRERFETEGNAERLSIRRALQLIRNTTNSKAASSPEDEARSMEIPVPEEDVQKVEARLAAREVVLVDADESFIALITALVRAAQKSGKEIEYQRIGAFDSEVHLNAPFKNLFAMRESPSGRG